MADCSQMSKTSVREFVGLTARATASLASEYIKFPDARDEAANIQKFQMLAMACAVLHTIAILHETDPPGMGETEESHERLGAQEVRANTANGAFHVRNNVIHRWF